MNLSKTFVMTLYLISSSSAVIADTQPGLGEVMLIIQQHHAKLYYAGTAGNWELAKYEFDELKENLGDAAKAHFEAKSVKTPLGDMIAGMTNLEMDAISETIKNKNSENFKKHFSGLTNACNRCHQAAEHPFIVIQFPTRNVEFSNQKFTR